MKKSFMNINKKWILTASLLSLLVTQYSYQSSSLTLAQANAQFSSSSGEYVLASRAPQNDEQQSASRPERPARPKPPEAPKEETPVTSDAADSSTSTDSSNEESKTETEANITTDGACTENCETPSIDEKSIQDLMKEITDLRKMVEGLKQAQQPATPPVDQKAPESECETPAANASRDERKEHRECLKQEKQDKKEEKEQARKEAIQEKFEERVDVLKERCDQDLECLSSGLTSLLSRFSGKNAPAAADVNKAFRDLLSAPMAKALYSDDPEAIESTLASIQALMQDMPDQYRNLKQSVMNAVKNQTTVAAKKVSDGYAKLQTLSKENNPQAYFQALQETQQEQQKLTYLSNSYSSSIEQSLQTVGDTTTLSYYQRSYVPDMQKILASMMAPTQTTTTTTDGAGRTGRNGQQVTTGQPTTVTTNTAPSIQDPNKMVRGNETWNFPNGNSGVSIGNPSTTPTVNGRRPR